MAPSEAFSQIELDSRNCLTLEQILQAFMAPISEQHAWAVVHQATKCLASVLEQADMDAAKFMVMKSRDIIIHKDGFVHKDTFLSPRLGRQELSSQRKLMSELGMVVYEALDHTMPEESQRKISTDLEVLLETMTDVDSDDESDEGIEDDESGEELIKNIEQLCRKHLEVESSADEHYSGVCHALVMESLDISTFMAKVRESEASNNDELMKLGLKDWSSIWQQLMKQLRDGIKLKKVDCSKTATEFELTPFELLMDDIRTKKYKLNPVEIPLNVQKDAKNEILEFIRSRPPLKSASMRVLKPKPNDKTPAERLLEDIRSGSTRQSLRKSVPQKVKEKIEKTKRKRLVSEKKIIELDEELVNDLLNFDIEDDNDCDSPTIKTEAIDLTVLSPIKEIIDLTSSPVKDEGCIVKSSPKRLTKSISDGNMLKPVVQLKPSTPLCKQVELASQSSQLSLEEFCHIQVQMDTAELASMDDKALQEDLSRGKVCFRCKTSRFGIFTWSTECYVCSRYICSKCLTSIVISNSDAREIPLSAFVSPREDSAFHSPCNSGGRFCDGCQALWSPRDLHTPLHGGSRVFSPGQIKELTMLTPSPRFGMASSTKISPPKSKKKDASPSMGLSAPPIFKRSKTMSRAEGSTRKAKLRLAMNSGLKQQVCKYCVEMMTYAVMKETIQSDKSSCQKCQKYLI